MYLSKTDFVHFLRCSKSLWFLKHKPDQYPHGEFTDYMRKITNEGYEVESYVKGLILSKPDADLYSFQSEFKTAGGLYARGDVTRENENGTINIYEVKSSTSVKVSPKHNQIKDVTFQKVAAEETGLKVDKSFIIHLNGDYEKNGEIDSTELLIFEDVSNEVASIEAQTRIEIEAALAMLAQTTINEKSCSCLSLSKSNHCDTFAHFNPGITTPSIYNLPRISKSKLEGFIANGRFDLGEIKVSEVTPNQAPVLNSAHNGKPYIDESILDQFFSQIEYPMYFLDYETYSSAIPIVDGVRPHSPIPFQYSLHVKRSPSDLNPLHIEYLSDKAELPFSLLEHLQKNLGPVGSVVSWHASFENTQNRNMSDLYPSKADFLHGLIARTIDLEDLFKDGYVDIAFGGSTSIKNILPVIAPDLTYTDKKIASGTDAMEAWMRLISMPPGGGRDALRKSMLEYCALDTYAMVRIFDELSLVFASSRVKLDTS